MVATDSKTCIETHLRINFTETSFSCVYTYLILNFDIVPNLNENGGYGSLVSRTLRITLISKC
jgi:hypothetical protein